MTSKSLVVHSTGLGGLIQLLPVLRALKERGDVVHMCGQTENDFLAKLAGLADMVSGLAAMPSENAYNTIYSAFVTGPFVNRYPGAVRLDLRERPDQVLDQARLIGDPVPQLTFPGEAPAVERSLVIFPFGRWGIWPVDNWQQLLARTWAQWDKIHVVTDWRLAHGEERRLVSAKSVMHGNEGLNQLLPVLRAASAWVCCEGGIGHLMAALGVPGVMLRGGHASQLTHWAPRQPSAVSLMDDGSRGPGYLTITVDQVIAALTHR